MINNNGDLITAQKSTKSLFFSGVIVLTVANLLVKAVGLISKIALNRVVGSIGAGYYSTAYEIYAYLYVISTSGLPVALSIMVSKSRSKGRLLEAKKIFNIAISMFLVIGFVFSIIMILFSKSISLVIGAPKTSLCIIAIAPTMLFICISSCFRGYFQGYQLMTPTAISQFIEAACKVLIGVEFAVWAKSRGYSDHIVASYTILGVTFGVLLGMFFLYIRKIFFKEEMYIPSEMSLSNECKKTKALFKEMLLIAIPITISSSVLSLTTILDTLMVQSRLIAFGMNETTVRIYYGDYTSLVISMFTLPTILLYPISNSLVPLISSARENGKLKSEEKIRFLSIRIITIFSIPCAMGLGLFSHQILELLMFKRDSVDRAAPWLSIASISIVFLGIIAITNAFLNSYGQQRLPIISMIAGATVKLVSNYFLLSKIEIFGAPVSTVLCYFVAASLNVYFVLKKIGTLPKLSSMLVYPFLCSLFSIGGSAIFYYLLSNFIPSRILTILCILISVVVYSFLILRMKVITTEEITVLPKSEKIIKILKKLKFISTNS